MMKKLVQIAATKEGRKMAKEAFRKAFKKHKSEVKRAKKVGTPVVPYDLVKMTECRVGLALVGTKEELKGVITDGDIRIALIDNKNFAELKAKHLMNTNPLTALESDNLQVAEKRMREAKVQCLIVKNLINEVVGVIQIFE